MLIAGPPGDGVAALRDRLDVLPGITVCGEAPDGPAALRVAIEHRPDVCLVSDDGRLGSVAVVEMFVQRAPHVSVVLWGPEPDDDALLDAVTAGASGYLPSALATKDVGAALLDVAAGRPAFPRKLTRLLIQSLREDLWAA